jgi:hypothetical protein
MPFALVRYSHFLASALPVTVLVAIFVSLTLPTTFAQPSAPQHAARATVLFSANDASNDEFGTYPTDATLFPANQTSLFDLRAFSVSSRAYLDANDRERAYVAMHFEFANLWNALDAPFGFTHPLIHVYLVGEPAGSWRIPKSSVDTTPLISNPSLELDDRYRWNYMV